MAKNWPGMVVQRSFIKEHSFPYRLYIFTTCAAIQANLVKINQKMGMFPAISAICKTLPQNMANGKSKQWAVRRTCLQVLLAKHEVTSIDLKCCDRHAEIQKYWVPYIPHSTEMEKSALHLVFMVDNIFSYAINSY